MRLNYAATLVVGVVGVVLLFFYWQQGLTLMGLALLAVLMLRWVDRKPQ